MGDQDIYDDEYEKNFDDEIIEEEEEFDPSDPYDYQYGE